MGVVLIVAGSSALMFHSARYRYLRQLLERPWRVERFIYRHHLAFGGAVVAGALIFLILLFRYHSIDLRNFSWPASHGALLMLLVRSAAWVFAGLALLIGVIVAVRPSALKGIEQKANRWVGPSPPTFFQHRNVGILLLVAGIACLWLAARNVPTVAG